jgi:hypothetical protein
MQPIVNFYPRCGKEFRENARFCEWCGANRTTGEIPGLRSAAVKRPPLPRKLLSLAGGVLLAGAFLSHRVGSQSGSQYSPEVKRKGLLSRLVSSGPPDSKHKDFVEVTSYDAADEGWTIEHAGKSERVFCELTSASTWVIGKIFPKPPCTLTVGEKFYLRNQDDPPVGVGKVFKGPLPQTFAEPLLEHSVFLMVVTRYEDHIELRKFIRGRRFTYESLPPIKVQPPPNNAKPFTHFRKAIGDRPIADTH